MGICGVTGIVRGKRATVTTEGDPTAARHPDLIDRQWDTPQCPDQWRVADFTYVWTLAGFCYVAFVVDVYSRRILGWRASMSKRSDLVLSALEQAIGLRRRGAFEFTSTGLVHHSDAGSQYVSLAMTEALREAGMDGSIGSVGDALDNALMESTIGLYKTELIDLEHSRRWSGRNEVERETADWVRWFNDERLHSSIGYRPPVEYEQLYHSDTTAEAQAAQLQVQPAHPAVAVRGALFGVPVDLPDRVVHIQEHHPVRFATSEQGREVAGQTREQVGAGGVELLHVPVGEGPQEGAQRGGRPHSLEQARHGAVAQQVKVIDAVRAGQHPRHHACGFGRGVR